MRLEDLPGLDEPVGLRSRLATETEAVRAEIASGGLLAGPVWKAWGTALAGAGVDRATLTAILRGYDYEVWLWAVGERTWAQCVAGLAGRLRRRSGGQKAPRAKASRTKATTVPKATGSSGAKTPAKTTTALKAAGPARKTRRS